MEKIKLEILSEENAKEICSWRYEGDYAVYNFSDWEVVKENKWDLAIEMKRTKEFLSIYLDNKLIAYGRIFINENKTFLGIGIKPSLCGNGYGKKVMTKLVEEAKIRYPDNLIVLEVRSFNKRAVKCYETVGFKIKNKYKKSTYNGSDDFYYMEYKNN